MEDRATLLAEIIRNVVAEKLEGKNRAALMFSGGLDSSLLAVISRKHCDIILYIAGFEGSPDLDCGTASANLMDIPFKEVLIQENDVLRSMTNVVTVHRMENPKWMSTFVCFDIVLRNIPEDTVLCGQGADELFGGYMKYTRMEDPADAIARDVKALKENEMAAYESMAKNYGKTLIAPYLDPLVEEFAMTVPLSLKIGETENKIILRQAARIMGVPGLMADRQKKAMQYGTGVSRAIQRILKSRGQTLNQFIVKSSISGK